MGADEVVDTPEYNEFSINRREESLQRILSRMSPNGRRAYLQTLSEGADEIRTPPPFSVPETEDEFDLSDGGEQEDRRPAVDYLLDSPIPELTTKSLIPPPDNGAIQSKPLRGAHPNITVRTPKHRVRIDVRMAEMNRNFLSQLPADPPDSRMPKETTCSDVLVPQLHVRPKPFVPSETERLRVHKNLFPETRTAVTNTVWSNTESHPVIKQTGVSRSRTSVDIKDPGQTYPKLLEGVEMFSSPCPPLGLGSKMRYASRTGVGHRIILPDGRMEYQYFEPIQTERVPEHKIIREEGGNLRYGHGTIPDQGHFDPLLEGGINRSAYAHQPGLQKIFNEVAAASLPHGRQSTHAVSHELYRGKPLADEARPADPLKYAI